MKQLRCDCGVLALALLGVPAVCSAQLTGVEGGEWRYLGGDAGSTRSAPLLNQIDASNFSDLEVAWIWQGHNSGGGVEYTSRSTPVFVDGVLFTVTGQRRQVVAIDAATGERLWTFREPETMRYLRSPRTDFGKGVAYAEVDGRGVIYITTPAFFLWALDAKTGRPLENWGAPVSLEGFSEGGVL
ncbi:MAG: PQQ-binding-like beta-propeller repeat protein, partial [Vicinamibacterales bacterium]|nr:PQQ-binding-like beta-propeller repeat protein [Vicinamibacterales bacterium]